MRTIEEKAKDYEKKYYDGAAPDSYLAFIRGAQSEREELTRWHDVETMPAQKGVLIKLSSGDYCVGIKDLRGKIWGLPPYLRNPKPVGWREIHENE